MVGLIVIVAMPVGAAVIVLVLALLSWRGTRAATGELAKRRNILPYLMQWLVPLLSVPGRLVFWWLTSHRWPEGVVNLLINTLLFVIVPLAPSVIYRRQRLHGATVLAIMIACAALLVNLMEFCLDNGGFMDFHLH